MAFTLKRSGSGGDGVASDAAGAVRGGKAAGAKNGASAAGHSANRQLRLLGALLLFVVVVLIVLIYRD
ncbi:MAG: hypothetical protein RBT86_06235, partial [Azospira sp.]|nr:hypothetical protein [Azospira sp.]